jgi:hypothetical protein
MHSRNRSMRGESIRICLRGQKLMNQETYSEKLKRPQWQRRRLEKMQQANFCCEICDDDSEQLHVHHKQYLKIEPWEYPDSMLMCLCKTCHDIVHMDQEKVKRHCKRLAIKKEVKHVNYFERIVPSRKAYAGLRQFDQRAIAEWLDLRNEAAQVVKSYRDRADKLFQEWTKRNPRSGRLTHEPNS